MYDDVMSTDFQFFKDPNSPTVSEIIRQDRIIWALDGPPKGRRPRGTFRPEQIKAIRLWKLRRGTGEFRFLAQQLGVSQDTLSSIRALRSYKHVRGQRGEFAPMPEKPLRIPRRRGVVGAATDDQVRLIRSVRVKYGQKTLEKLSAETGLSLNVIHSIRRGATYRHVPK